jgi:hypothetical protein
VLGGGSRCRGRSPASVRKQEEGVRWAEWGEMAKRASWLAGPTGRNLKRISFLNKNWIIKYTKALEICTRRFRRNFDIDIFPKFF